MSMPKTQFSVWLRSQVFGQDEKCRKIIIRHATPTARIGQVLFSIDIPNDCPEDAAWDDWITEQVNTIENITQADADSSITGVEKYSIQTFHGEDNKPSATFSIRVRGENSDGEDDGLLSEPATKSGLLAQLMRHNEAIMRMSTVGTHDILKAMNSTIHKQEEVIEKLLNEKFENLGVVDELISRKHERELEQSKVAHDMEMKEKLFEKSMLIVPLIANKLLSKGNNGQKVLPTETTTIEQELAALAETLTDDEIKQMFKILSPEKSLVLADLLKSVVTKQHGLLQKPNKESDEKPDEK